VRLQKLFAVLTAVALAVSIAGGVSAADQYSLDIVHSSIQFSVKHMVISNVKGTFDKFDGVVNYDPENIANSSVEVTIDVGSINTKDEKRDEHLRSEDFLDASKHPNISFKSNKIVKKDDGYVAVGTLTIRGVSKEVELPFVVNGPITNPWGQTVIGVEVEFKLNRQDYGVKWNKTMDSGGLVVGDDIKIEINLEAKKS
jgi:polyisoprenoid-binding protein YceI